MANVTDLANNAAAVTAGYAQTDTDKGAAANPRYLTRFEKWHSGAPGKSGFLHSEIGEDNTSQANASALALSRVNAWRRTYYGGSPGRASGAGCPQSADPLGGAHVIDAT